MELKKTILSAALSAALLAGAAFAAPLTALPQEPADETQTQAPGYSLTQRSAAQPIFIQGKAAELGDNSLTIQNDDETGAYSKVVVNLDEATLILDAATGEGRTFADIKKDELLFAYVGPAMTRSIPPITTARLILCGIPESGLGVPTYAQILSVTPGEDGAVSLYVTGDMVLHLTGEAKLSAFRTKNVVGTDDLKPGMRILSWYDMVLESFPGQTYPTQVMTFPYEYAGYVAADGLQVSVNGQALALEGTSAAKVEGDRLLVPVRTLAEALGCTVSWEPYTNQVVVKSGETTLYSFAIGGDTVTAEGDMVVGLLTPANAVDGVTFMALDDLVSLHGLMLEQTFGF